MVRRLIADHLAVPCEAVTERARFQQDLGADTLDMVQLSMLLESLLGVVVEDHEAEACLSVGDALQLLRSKVPEAAR